LSKLSRSQAFELVVAARELAQRQGRPWAVHLDITYRCDLDCEHCYLDDKVGWPELKTDRLLALIDELADYGVWMLLWSGGEIFSRPDWRELLAHAAARGLNSRVKTHGGNIDAEVAGWLVAHRVARAEVSVYSLSPAVHDGITRVPGSLARTLAGVRALRQAGMEVMVSIVAMAANVDELEQIHEAFWTLGCIVKFGIGIVPDNAASDQLDELDLDEETLFRAYRALYRVRLREGGTLPEPGRLDPSGEPCGAGRTSAYVAPDGAVWPCVVFPLPLGNLHEQSFRAIWEGSPARAALAEFRNDSRDTCQSCSAANTCNYCAGEALKRTGDYRVAPPEFHLRTRARMRALQEVRGEALPRSLWGGIPQGGHSAALGRKRKAVFPIYRPARQRPPAP
jgi:radical SAM protein with 4Fe4S-binding SPASM domain